MVDLSFSKGEEYGQMEQAKDFFRLRQLGALAGITTIA